MVQIQVLRLTKELDSPEAVCIPTSHLLKRSGRCRVKILPIWRKVGAHSARKRQHQAARIASMRWNFLKKIGRSQHGFALLRMANCAMPIICVNAMVFSYCYRHVTLDYLHSRVFTEPSFVSAMVDGILCRTRRFSTKAVC